MYSNENKKKSCNIKHVIHHYMYLETNQFFVFIVSLTNGYMYIIFGEFHVVS